MKDINYLWDLNGVALGEKINPVNIIGCENTRFLEKRKDSFIGGEFFELGAMITEFKPSSSGEITIANHYYMAEKQFPEYNAFANKLEELTK